MERIIDEKQLRLQLAHYQEILEEFSKPNLLEPLNPLLAQNASAMLDVPSRDLRVLKTLINWIAYTSQAIFHEIRTGQPVSPALDASNIIMARLSGDLLGLHQLVLQGSIVPAATLASSILELSLIEIVIGNDNGKAKKWLKHKNKTHTPWSIRLLSDWASNDFPLSFYAYYQRLCLYKLGNPVSKRAVNIQHTDSELVLAFAPLVSEPHRQVIQETTSIASTVVYCALVVYFHSHVPSTNPHFQHLSDSLKLIRDLIAVLDAGHEVATDSDIMLRVVDDSSKNL